ncbi:MAG: anhydro-N-acetylmuramic acid kinase [Rhodothermales bacterium]|nr:anhydro-N-acetylmuramic acid kinase [Rhodothermales bacterium]
MRRSLVELLELDVRVVAGLMSGTSLDGVDCAVVRIGGSGSGVDIEVLSFASIPYPDELRQLILRNSAVESSSVRDLSQINFRLAHSYRDAVAEACRLAGLDLSELDAIGSHGQTVHHVPEPDDCAGMAVTSTLQIGDPSVLANLTGVVTVGDFRVADMALGGQGAPLVPYLDYVLFGSDSMDRILLNIGGISNLTVLPAAGGPADVIAFDTGPGNMLIDGVVQRLFGRRFDEGGHIASSATVDEGLLASLLSDDYYELPPPKSTGREKYTDDMVQSILDSAIEAECPDADVVATVTELTARTIADAVDRFVRGRYRPEQLLAAGGGVHNSYIMSRLATLLPGIDVTTVSSSGVDPDSKEAVCFALFAHETLDGCPTNMPSVTGASRATVLGKICVPA